MKTFAKGDSTKGHADLSSPIWTEEKEECYQTKKRDLIRLLEERYGKKSSQSLDFHDPEHSIYVAETYIRLAENIRELDPSLISVYQIKLGGLYALGHDLVQNYNVRKNGNIHSVSNFRNIKRGVDSLGNEGSSAIDLYNILKRDPVCSIEFDLEDIRKHLIVTYPLIEPSDMRIWQPYLYKDCSMSEFLLALSDLPAKYGIENFSRYNSSNWAEFRELHIGISVLVKSTPLNLISIDDRIFIGQKILSWASHQSKFVYWQKNYFEGYQEGKEIIRKAGEKMTIESLNILNEPDSSSRVKEYLNSVFCNFDNNIKESERSFVALCSVFLEVSKKPVEEHSFYVNDPVNADEIKEKLSEKITNDSLFSELIKTAGYERSLTSLIDRKLVPYRNYLIHNRLVVKCISYLGGVAQR